MIGKLTHLDQTPGGLMVIGPGRWGTTTPSLGVPVSFTEIETVGIICELAVMHDGLTPDPSMGTHFFNNLVEADMLYLALYPERDGHQLNVSFLEAKKNLLTEFLPDAKNFADIILVLEAEDLAAEARFRFHADTISQHVTCYVERTAESD